MYCIIFIFLLTITLPRIDPSHQLVNWPDHLKRASSTSAKASGSWCSVLEDLSEHLEINLEFLLPIASIIFRRIHAHQIHCGLRLLRRRWEAAFQCCGRSQYTGQSSQGDHRYSPYTYTCGTRALTTPRTHAHGGKAFTRTVSWIKMKIPFHGVTRGN